ncbi:MAG: hypothetical protein ACT4ON_07970, partial [Bacteroidota bacterium]
MNFKITILFLFFCNILSSQNQNKKWYFGDHAALDFSSGSPVALTNSQLNTAEGCSTISDNTGNLLFYTDGQTVYNKNHIVMPNGTGLLGHPSTTQSALIVLKPGSNSLYYVFTIYHLGGAMTYSIVDMTLQSGSGDVTSTKNVVLHPAVSEKQCAVQRCDGNIWIISHESTTTTFYADLLTPAGISPSILSSVGTSHAGGGGGGTFNTVGQLKVSQQGDRLALAIRDAALFEVFDFNINSGIINNPITINAGSYPVAYGVEFSPDGSKLYGGIITSNSVYQFNLLAGSAAAISSSATLVGSSSGFTNSLQIGTDGKIYVAKSVSQTSGIGFLDVINNPNLLGSSCSYVNSGISLSGKLSLLGLPNLAVYPSGGSSLAITGTTTICNGTSTILSTSGGGTYSWSTTETTSAISVSPTISTSYSVTVTSGACSGTATVQVTVVNNSIPTITGSNSVCPGASTTLTGNGGTTYVWNNGQTTASITVSPSVQTTYTVTANKSGCTGQTTVVVSIPPPPVPTISGNTAICNGDSTTLTATAGGTYEWNTGATTASITVSPPITTTYTVTVTAGCTASSTVVVTVQAPVTPTITGKSIICTGTSTTLSTSGGGTYAWSDGATGSSITVSPTSNITYTVTVTNGLCSGTASIFVTVNPNPSPVIVGTTTICSGQSTSLTTNGGGTYQWGQGQTTSMITISPTTTTSYTVTVTTNGCTRSATAQVTVKPTPTPTITGTITICTGQSTMLTSSTAGPFNWSTGASTDAITVTPPVTTTFSVSVTQNGCTGTSNIVVTVIPTVVASITGNDICAGQSTTLAAKGGNNFLWNSGVSTSTITVSPVATTTYTVFVSVGACADTTTHIVTVNPLPIPFASGDTTILNGQGATLNSGGGGTYQWIPSSGLSCITCSNPTATPSATTQYCVIVKDSVGCADSACVTITIENKCGDNGELFVPNGFSPNADGQNDVLYI